MYKQYSFWHGSCITEGVDTKPNIICQLNVREAVMRKLVSIVTAVVTVMICQAHATPSTQIWIPSTDIQAYLNPHWGFDDYIGAYNAGNALPSNGNVYNAGVTVGVLPPKAVVGLEVGIDYRDNSGNHADPVLFNAKLGLSEDAFFKNMPAIAIGGFDFGTKDSATNFDVTYGLIAKNIWKLGRFSVGGYKGWGPDILWTSSSGKVENGGVLASWDRTMNEISSKLWFGVDFMSGNNGYGAVSFGASWNFTPTVSTILGYDIWNDKDLGGPGLYKPTFTVQIDINTF